MKSLLSFTLLLCYALLFPACSKDGSDKSCETVVNANGPAFIKVVNDRSETVQVYLGDFMPFGAELQSGHCEIYGVPVKHGSVEISTLDGSKSRDVDANTQDGQTITISVGAGFF